MCFRNDVFATKRYRKKYHGASVKIAAPFSCNIKTSHVSVAKEINKQKRKFSKNIMFTHH